MILLLMLQLEENSKLWGKHKQQMLIKLILQERRRDVVTV